MHTLHLRRDVRQQTILRGDVPGLDHVISHIEQARDTLARVDRIRIVDSTPQAALVEVVLHEGLADTKYRPCPLLVKYVEAGWLGRKANRGFYDYRGEKPVPTR